MNQQKIIIEGKKLKKTYQKNNHLQVALNEVDISLYEGEILGVVGESGSGKSTLLRMISGIERPDEGMLFYEGSEYTNASLKTTGEFLQIIFQDAYGSFDPHMSMQKSLQINGNYTEEELITALSKVNLSVDLLNRKPHALSGGQCQRMAICRALLRKTKILLCDEITSALDVTTQAKVIELIAKLNQSEKLSMIFVSHDIALVSNICHRIMIMKDGNVVEEGITDEVILSPNNEYTKALLYAATGIGQ